MDKVRCDLAHKPLNLAGNSSSVHILVGPFVGGDKSAPAATQIAHPLLVIHIAQADRERLLPAAGHGQIDAHLLIAFQVH